MQVFAINLPSRTERRSSIVREFQTNPEFDIELTVPVFHPKPNVSLWLTIQQIVQVQLNKEGDFFILCEDDHQFTKNYNTTFLQKCIAEAQLSDADILLGGVSWQKNSVQVSENLFWMENFSGLQFTVIFKKFYNSILTAEFGDRDTADHKISALTHKKFVIYPAISTQKEFGYSDVTPGNNATGRVDFLFEKTNKIFDSLNKVRSYYLPNHQHKLPPTNPDDIVLPVYIINLKERAERLAHITAQFAHREEFETHIIEAVKDKNGRLGLWKSIVLCVQKAIDNDEDFFILCEDDHVFTEDYDKGQFITQILQSYYQKADLLSGGIGGFGVAIPVSTNRYWVDWFWSTQFVVIYKQFYQKILRYDFQENDTADGVFSTLTNNKLAIYPFSSVQKDFGYSDVTVQNNEKKGLISKFFEDAGKRLAVYRDVVQMYIGERFPDNKGTATKIQEQIFLH